MFTASAARRVQMVGTLSVAGRTQASYLGGSGSRVRTSVQMARDLVRDNGVREALSVSGSYVSGLWARLNGLRASAATERLPLGMATPLSDASAPPPSALFKPFFITCSCLHAAWQRSYVCNHTRPTGTA